MWHLTGKVPNNSKDKISKQCHVYLSQKIIVATENCIVSNNNPSIFQSITKWFNAVYYKPTVIAKDISNKGKIRY